MMSYLFIQAQENEAQYSGKPTLGGRQTGEGSESDEDGKPIKKKYDGLMQPMGKQKKKKDQKKQDEDNYALLKEQK